MHGSGAFGTAGAEIDGGSLAGADAGEVALRNVRDEDDRARILDRENFLVFRDPVSGSRRMGEHGSVRRSHERAPDQVALRESHRALRVAPLSRGMRLPQHFPRSRESGVRFARDHGADRLPAPDHVSVRHAELEEGARERSAHLLLHEGRGMAGAGD